MLLLLTDSNFRYLTSCLCRKEITFVNIKNKSNDQFVEVRANNIDPLRITFHSVFYHLITPHSHNYLDFENVIVGAPAVLMSLEPTKKKQES